MSSISTKLTGALRTQPPSSASSSPCSSALTPKCVVDGNREGGGFGWIQVDPFVEVELRLRDFPGDRDLLLIRNQEHAEIPEASAFEMANQLVMFLR